MLTIKSYTMIIAQLPLNENDRLRDLYSYDILNTPAEADFDELVELACQICKCPISLITLIDGDIQWLKSKKGIDKTQTPRDTAFCSHAILQNDVMVVENALEDERFHDNPFVTGDPNIRFYAGAPIISPAGHKLGTVCIIDSEPRQCSEEEKRSLKLLSNQVTKLLEIKRKNMVIRQRAEEIIALKSEAINNFMQQTEKIKKKIAADLHEDFSQSLASGIMFLKMAEQNPGKAPSIIQDVRKQLTETLSNMRELSYMVIPPTDNWITSREMVTEYFKVVAVTYPFEITITGEETDLSADPDITLAGIRVIEQWLKLLGYKDQVTAVEIEMNISDILCFRVYDNDMSATLEHREKEILRNILCDQVHALGGTIVLSVSNENNNNVLTILLPFEQEHVLQMISEKV